MKTNNTHKIAVVFALSSLGSVAQRLVPVGEGLQGGIGVNDAVIFQNKLVMGGSFTLFNGVAVEDLCSWDGQTVEPLDAGFTSVSGQVRKLAVLTDRLIVAMTGSVHGDVAAWDGATWTDLQWGFPGQVRSLHVHADVLYVGGSEGHVARWDGTVWQLLGSPIPGRVEALTFHSGILYAGMSYMNALGPVRLAAWDGTDWEAVGPDLNGAVLALYSDASGLLVGGVFTATADDLQLLPALARWDGEAFNAMPNVRENNVRYIGRTTDGVLAVASSAQLYMGEALEHDVPLAEVIGVHDLNGTRYVLGRGSGGDSFVPCNRIARLEPGSNTAVLDVNNAQALLTPSPHGFDTWWDGPVRFEAPQGQGVDAVFAAAPWLLGEKDNVRHGAITAYAPLPWFYEVRDWAGPLSTDIDTPFLENYHRVWKLDRAQVQAHVLGWSAPGYVMPEAIASWPGNGDVSNGEPGLVAPFMDLNGNAIYEPAQGEYPLIKGDQAIYAITHTNDQWGFFTDSLLAFPFDLHIMHYAYEGANDPALANTVFVNYQYVNRSEETFTDVRFAQFADIDIGNPDDDFAGCDSTRNMFFIYNWDEMDETTAFPGYGEQPPAVAVKFLDQPMLSHRIHPRLSLEPVTMDDVMYGLELGEPFQQLGYPTHFQFPGGTFVEEIPTLSTPDRRSVGATGPFTMGPGDTLCMDLAFIYARAGSGGAYASVEALKLRADSVQSAYDAFGIGCGSYPSMVSVPDVQVHEQVRLFPNPAQDRVTVVADTPVKGLDLLDAQGRLVLTASPTGTRSTLDLRGLMPGFYAVRIHTTVQTHVHRLVVH